MSEQLWSRVARELNAHAYMAGVERTVDRVRATGEIFTPTQLVVEMLQYVDLDMLAPGKTVLDPACGDGQFLVAAKWIKILHHGMTEDDALQDLYGIDIMRDNVDLCTRRLGGGTVVMGDALNPGRELQGQTVEERELMKRLFTEPTSRVRQKKRVAGTKPRRRKSSDTLHAAKTLDESDLALFTVD
uniref:M.AgsIB n=1 Tax=Agrococcus sp. 25 TaxID=1682745 RepID=A0A0H5RZ88_9MICO|nr:M.AgsIB [Agrococcus sp. 25]